MTVAIILEHRFVRRPDGRVFTTGPFPYSFWSRYLTVFDEVLVVARVSSRSGETGAATNPDPDNGPRADGPAVSFAPLPYYRGPQQFLARLRVLRQTLIRALAGADGILLRLPSAAAMLAEPWLRETGRPFSVEVVGDPWDALAPGAFRHPLRGLIRRALARSQRRLCAASQASLYVTREALQRRYPSRSGNFSIACSDVELPPRAFVEQPRRLSEVPQRPLLVTVGSLNHLYKGQDVLLDAVARCVDRRLDLRLEFIGDGNYRPMLESRAKSLGIASRIQFRGQVACGEDVRGELDRADLFVLPSRQEGLPRALLEAMARAMPAIGSMAGGIPELLPAEDLVPAGCAHALAEKIAQVLGDPSRQQKMSTRNLFKARDYEETILARERKSFLEQVRWQSGRPVDDSKAFSGTFSALF